MPITQFPTRADGVVERITDFMSHLRFNGVGVGVAETELALLALASIDAIEPNQMRLALKAICTKDAECFGQFDELFNAYWYGKGRRRDRAQETKEKPYEKNRWSNRSLLESEVQGSGIGNADIAISMDGKGAWRDNVFVERLWRTIKYEEVYLHAYQNVPEARAAIGKYLIFYNTKRPHSSLDGQTPDHAYFNPLQPIPVAA